VEEVTKGAFEKWLRLKIPIGQTVKYMVFLIPIFAS
jgi:hypothetical protein